MEATELIESGVSNEVEERWSDSKFEEMASLWNLSAKERADMVALQSRLSDIHHWKNDPFEVVRYYKEYRSVPKAACMFQRMVEWRLRERVDAFLDRYGEPLPNFHYLPVFLCRGFDRDGDPIYVERTGASDPYGLVLEHGIDAIADYTQFIREITTSRRISSAGHRYCWQRDYYEPLQHRRVKQFTVIMDMEGLSHRHIRGGLLGLLQRMARISQDMYAGFGKRVIIYRAPAIFQWAWNHIVKHFFDPHIRDIIIITSHEDYLQVTEQYIDLNVLPECLAPGIGQGRAMPGYFEKVHLEGGMIPTDHEEEDSEQPVCTKTTIATEATLEEEEQGQVEDTLPGSKLNASARVLLKGQWNPQNQHVTVFNAQA